HYVRVLRRLARNSVDDLPLHAQRTYSRNGEIDAAEHDAGLKVDRSSGLCVGGSWIVNRNIPFGRLVLTIGWRRQRRRYRLLRPAALTTARIPPATAAPPPTAAIKDGVFNPSGNTGTSDCQTIQRSSALSLRRSGTDEILSGLKPE